MKRSVKVALAAVIALPIVAVSALSLFVDANTFRPMIESRLSAALSRKTTLGGIKLSLWTGSLVARDLAIEEDPAFGQTAFFTAKRMRIGVDLEPLIFERQLVIRRIQIDAPEIHLIRAANGAWNFSTLSHANGQQSGGQQSPVAMPADANVSIGHIEIRDGSARIDTFPVVRKPQVYDHLDVALEDVALAKAFTFTVKAELPGNGKVKLTGTAGPINPQDAAATAFDTQVTIAHLDPVAAGYVEPAAGISMTADLDTHIVSDGIWIVSDGKAHAEHLILLKGGRAAPHPLNINYQIRHSLKDNSGAISDIALQTGRLAVHVSGAYQIVQNVPVFQLKLQAPNIPIDSLQALMPAVGIELPDGTYLKGGTLSANFAIQGSAKDSVITGSYAVKNTTLVGYDLGSKIVGVAALGGIKTGNNTVIDAASADLRITKAGTESTQMYSVLPAFGTSTGDGTISPSGALDFHLITNVTGAKGLGKVGVSLLTRLNSTSSAAKPSIATGIPITITGTAEKPVITADVSNLIKGNTEALRSKGADILDKTGLSRLFNKKQQPH